MCIVPRQSVSPISRFLRSYHPHVTAYHSRLLPRLRCDAEWCWSYASASEGRFTFIAPFASTSLEQHMKKILLFQSLLTHLLCTSDTAKTRTPRCLWTLHRFLGSSTLQASVLLLQHTLMTTVPSINNPTLCFQQLTSDRVSAHSMYIYLYCK